MQAPRVDALPSWLSAPLGDRILDLIEDPQTSVEVTYKTLGAVTHDIEAGTSARTKTSATFRAVRETATEKVVERSGGKLQVGDVRYIFDQSEIAADPKAGDEIVEGTEVRHVVVWDSDSLDTLWLVWARR